MEKAKEDLKNGIIKTITAAEAGSGAKIKLI